MKIITYALLNQLHQQLLILEMNQPHLLSAEEFFSLITSYDGVFAEIISKKLESSSLMSVQGTLEKKGVVNVFESSLVLEQILLDKEIRGESKYLTSIRCKGLMTRFKSISATVQITKEKSMSDLLLIGRAPSTSEGNEYFLHCMDWWWDIYRQ